MPTTYKDKNNNKLAVKITVEEIGSGLTFFSDDGDYLQVGAWRYPAGKKLLAHIHKKAERTIPFTQEFVFVVKGSIKAILYDNDENLIEEVQLNAQEGMIMLSGGHGYEIIEEDSIILETKNGPYVGAEADRRRIES